VEWLEKDVVRLNPKWFDMKKTLCDQIPKWFDMKKTLCVQIQSGLM